MEKRTLQSALRSLSPARIYERLTKTVEEGKHSYLSPRVRQMTDLVQSSSFGEGDPFHKELLKCNAATAAPDGPTSGAPEHHQVSPSVVRCPNPCVSAGESSPIRTGSFSFSTGDAEAAMSITSLTIAAANKIPRSESAPVREISKEVKSVSNGGADVEGSPVNAATVSCQFSTAETETEIRTGRPSSPPEANEGGPSMSPSSPNRPRLILHIDINKTILIRDHAQDAGSDSMVNVLLGECAWGRLMPGPLWIPVGRLATDRPSADPDLMTYRSYLDGYLLPFEKGFGKDVDKANDAIKAKRQTLKRAFTSPGQPGEMFRGVYDKLMASLKVPPERQKEMQEAGVGDGTELVLLPSFFELLKYLQAQGRDFAIIFRTFGTDALEIIQELNFFCTGKHPMYPDVRMDGSDGRTDLRLGSCGCFYRFGKGPCGTFLALNAPDKIVSSRVVRPEVMEEVMRGDGGDGSVTLCSFRDIYEGLMEECCQSDKNVAMALRDYYPWWKSHQERSTSGKLMVVDRTDDSIRQIFFDDNVGSGSPHIVDVRDVATGLPVPFSESNGKYLVKVEPLNAILDPYYFIRAVRRCEEAQEKQRCISPESGPASRAAPGLARWRSARIGVMSVVRLASVD